MIFPDFTFAYATYGIEGNIGVVPANITDQPVATRPDVDYGAGGGLSFIAARNVALGHLAGDMEQLLGPEVAELMQLDPVIAASINTLVESVMADGLVEVPRVVKLPELAPEDQPSEDDVAEAARATEFVQRSFARVGLTHEGVPFDAAVAMQYKQGLVNGHKLAEICLELAEDGEDKGRYVLKRYRLLENRTWGFVVDRHMNLVGYMVYVPRMTSTGVPMGAEIQFLQPDKFVLFSNEPHRGDPRGVSICRPCWPGWTLKMTLMPLWHAYLQLFASPKTVVIMPERLERGQSAEAADPAAKRRTPEQKILDAAVGLRSNTAATLPYGSQLILAEAKSDGQPFKICTNEVDRQNVTAILGSPRVNSEAEYGSRADSQTGKDVMDIKVKFQRRVAGNIPTRVAYYLLEVNFGRGYAEKYCPTVMLGDSGQEDFPARAHAVAELYTAGFFTADQKPALCRRYGWPMPSPESIELQLEADRTAGQPPAPAVPPGGQSVQPDPKPTPPTQEAA